MICPQQGLAWVLAGAALLAHPLANAVVIEDLLAVPAIQSLLARLPELAPLVKRCGNGGYRQRNATLCQHADQANHLARMPPELRAVMAHAPAAASLRELCLAAVGKPAQGSYLCAQLAQFDDTFKVQVFQRQQEVFSDRQMR